MWNIFHLEPTSNNSLLRRQTKQQQFDSTWNRLHLEPTSNRKQSDHYNINDFLYDHGITPTYLLIQKQYHCRDAALPFWSYLPVNLLFSKLFCNIYVRTQAFSIVGTQGSWSLPLGENRQGISVKPFILSFQGRLLFRL